ncbi:hypothetical protein L1987_12737 [Smallanthus sonchifolius]|uniref:Uncharacterized protein n=1 Tax=Smallanthus sonchifolius TaxID=185202 RepID=A0ACB9JFH7_9ASTR|nr:hypothetical protein L1987_12737 [Smallanthus sonchifolius]
MFLLMSPRDGGRRFVSMVVAVGCDVSLPPYSAGCSDVVVVLFLLKSCEEALRVAVVEMAERETTFDFRERKSFVRDLVVL